MYKLIFDNSFLKKLVKKNSRLKVKIVETLKQLERDPKHIFLNSHKVATRKFGERWSSKVSGDLRIIWSYDEKMSLVILVLSVGGHSGNRKVYK